MSNVYIAAAHTRPKSSRRSIDPQTHAITNSSETRDLEGGPTGETASEKKPVVSEEQANNDASAVTRITFAPDPRHTINEKGALRVAGPRDGDDGEKAS